MQIIIEITEESAPKIMQSIAAANGWPRDVTADTAERVTKYMLTTVGQWVASGTDVLTREATEAAMVEAIGDAVKISIQ